MASAKKRPSKTACPVPVAAQCREEATVRFAGRAKISDSRGSTVFCVRPRHAGMLLATVTKPGLKPASTRVRVRR